MGPVRTVALRQARAGHCWGTRTTPSPFPTTQPRKFPNLVTQRWPRSSPWAPCWRRASALHLAQCGPPTPSSPTPRGHLPLRDGDLHHAGTGLGTGGGARALASVGPRGVWRWEPGLALSSSASWPRISPARSCRRTGTRPGCGWPSAGSGSACRRAARGERRPAGRSPRVHTRPSASPLAVLTVLVALLATATFVPSLGPVYCFRDRTGASVSWTRATSSTTQPG